MPNAELLHAGDTIVKTLTFTLAPGEEAVWISLLMTRVQAASEHPTIGRSRCIVLVAQTSRPSASGPQIAAAAAVALPRVRFSAELRGIVPASICGGTYSPVFCLFAYADGRPATGFEIDADQRFALDVADDDAAVDAGPSIASFD